MPNENFQSLNDFSYTAQRDYIDHIINNDRKYFQKIEILSDEAFNALNKLLNTDLAKRVLLLPQLVYADLRDNNISPTADKDVKLAYVDEFMDYVYSLNRRLEDIKHAIMEKQINLSLLDEGKKLEQQISDVQDILINKPVELIQKQLDINLFGGE